MKREGRAVEDGYRSELVPGLRASADAVRLAEEMAFSSGRLAALELEPPGMYGEVRDLAVGEDLERATWMSFLIAYLAPLEDDDPFAGVQMLLARAPDVAHVQISDTELEIEDIPLGPRTSHEQGRGAATLRAYGDWVARGGRSAAVPAGISPEGSPAVSGPQARAFTGEGEWTPQRRFERLFERLALPGFHRRARFDLLLTMGRLGLYELQAGSLHLSAARGLSAEDPTTVAAKRVFGIGDPLLLERRSGALAEAAAVPLETLELALENWAAPQRASMGVDAQTQDEGALERARDALGL